MTDKTERDADLIERVEQTVGMGHTAWDTIDPLEIAAAFREALAAPAEGGQGELRKMIDAPPMPVFYTDASHAWAAGWERSYEAHRALIDSAGGAKGVRDAYEGAREDLLDWKGRAQRAERTLRGLGYTGIDASEPPHPAEGDGAVAWEVTSPRGHRVLNSHNPSLTEPGWSKRPLVYGDTHPAATAMPEGFVLVPRAAALIAANVADEWAVMFADIPGLEKYDRFQYGPAVEQMHDDMLAALTAAAPVAPKGGVADEATTAGMADEYRRWIDFYHAGEGDFADFMRREYPDQSEFATTPTEQGATGEQP